MSFSKSNKMSVTCPSLIASLDPSLCRAVDHYCERTSEAWTAEPINAISNVAFLVAGFAAWRLARKRHAMTDAPLIGALILIVPVIGVGSFIFHVVATRWTEWIDVIPILAFMLLYLWWAMSRLMGLSNLVKMAALLGFFAATFAIEESLPASILAGGAMYLPSLLAFVVVGLASSNWSPGARKVFLLATTTFMVSWVMRTSDEPLCPLLPIGTHFLWHIFNATTVYLLVRVAIMAQS